jgi:hypothetical protein
MIGLDGGGKKTILYKFKGGFSETTHPSGFTTTLGSFNNTKIRSIDFQTVTFSL